MNEKTTPVQTGTPGAPAHGTHDDKSKTAPVMQPTGQPANPAAPQSTQTPKV